MNKQGLEVPTLHISQNSTYNAVLHLQIQPTAAHVVV